MFSYFLFLFLAFGAHAQEPNNAPPSASDESAITKFMTELKTLNKKTKWSETIFPTSGWKMHGKSVEGRPLIYFSCGEGNKNTTLMLSSVHGDEVTPIYFGLRLVSWVKGE